MSWQEQLHGDSLSWLLEEDEPGVRYLAMRDLLGLAAGDVDLLSAQALAHTRGPISAILNDMKKLLSGLIREDPSMSDAIKALRPLGIRSNLDILQRGITPAARQALAEASGVPEALIAELVNRADFSRMPWASKATISNFIGAGYGSLAELANADPEQLYEDFFRYGASIGKNLKMGNEIDNSYRIAKIVPAVLKADA